MIRLRGVDVLSLIYFSIKVIILLSNNFTAFEYLYCNNLRRPERRLYNTIYILTNFFYVANLGGRKNRMSFRNGLFWIYKVQILAANTS